MTLNDLISSKAYTQIYSCKWTQSIILTSFYDYTVEQAFRFIFFENNVSNMCRQSEGILMSFIETTCITEPCDMRLLFML